MPVPVSPLADGTLPDQLRHIESDGEIDLVACHSIDSDTGAASIVKRDESWFAVVTR